FEVPAGLTKMSFGSLANIGDAFRNSAGASTGAAARFRCFRRRRMLEKSMLTRSNRLLIGLAAFAVLAVGLMWLLEWRGLAVPGYRLEAHPLVQTIVAAGRVIGVSRVQVGSEITGVVTERRVEEGDEVAP